MASSIETERTSLTPPPAESVGSSAPRDEENAPTETLPPLENGDRLTRSEFYRRWDAMPRVKKAERIEGRVILGGRVSLRDHGQQHSWIVGWLTQFCASYSEAECGVSSTVQLDLDNDLQPDAILRIASEREGQSRITEDGYIAGPPELVVEVAASSASHDLHEKQHIYLRSGVREYLVWKVLERDLVWFRVENDEYVPIMADKAGIIRSELFPGLWLHAYALLDGDIAKVLETLQQGIATPPHAEFVTTLQSHS